MNSRYTEGTAALKLPRQGEDANIIAFPDQKHPCHARYEQARSSFGSAHHAALRVLTQDDYRELVGQRSSLSNFQLALGFAALLLGGVGLVLLAAML